MPSLYNLLLFVAAYLPVTLAVPTKRQETSDDVTNRYIVTLKQGVKDFNAHISWVSDIHSGSLTRRDTNGVEREYHIANFNAYAGQFDAETIETIKNSPEVAAVEKDSIMTISDFPSEYPERTRSAIKFTEHDLTTQPEAPWGLGTVSHREPGSSDYIYDTSAGEGTYVYTIDSGVLTTHSEFGGRAIMGHSVFNHKNDTDFMGHGTHVAGTIAGSTYGVAKKANIVAVKVFDFYGSPQSVVLTGYDWAVNDILSKGIQDKAVINLSLEGVYSEIWDQAIGNAFSSGILSVVAAGNSGDNATNHSPAAAPDAITVGAIDSKWIRADYSNWGPSLDLFAPGSDVLSSYIGSDTATWYYSGTSMATPHVSGLVAYLQSSENLLPIDARARLQALATVDRVSDPGEGSVNYIIYNGNSV